MYTTIRVHSKSSLGTVLLLPIIRLEIPAYRNAVGNYTQVVPVFLDAYMMTRVMLFCVLCRTAP